MNVTKNYLTDGGDTLVLNGKVEIGEDAEFSGRTADNLEHSTATSVANLKEDFNELIDKLKKSGLMTGDTWNVDVKSVPGGTAQMPTPETIANSAHATFDITGTEITITLDCKVADLEDSNHGSTWGTHKWIGFGVDTGLASIVGIEYANDSGTDTTLTEGDATEATELGLSAGDFVQYIRAEEPEYLEGKKYFTLNTDEMQKTKFTMKIIEADS